MNFLEQVKEFAEANGEETPNLFKPGLREGLSIKVFVGWHGHHKN